MYSSTHPKVIKYMSEYGNVSEVWLHRQVRELSDVVAGIAAYDFLNQELFPTENPIKLGWNSNLAHRFGHLYWLIKKGHWVDDDELMGLSASSRISGTDHNIIHAHFLWNAPAALNIARNRDIPLVLTGHGTDVNRGRVDKQYRESLLPAFQESAAVIGVSHFICDQLKVIGCPHEKIVRIPLGVPLPLFPEAGSKRAETFVWICVASLRKVKGHKILIEGFASALAECPNMALWLVGDGELKGELEELAKDLGCSEAIQFLGEKSPEDVQGLLRKADAFVLASIVVEDGNLLKEEGLPVSLVEAAAVGLPLVATNCGGIPEICINHRTGILIPCNDVRAISDSMIGLVQDQEYAKKMGSRGRLLVEKEFDITITTRQLRGLYRKLLASRCQ